MNFLAYLFLWASLQWCDDRKQGLQENSLHRTCSRYNRFDRGVNPVLIKHLGDDIPVFTLSALMQLSKSWAHSSCISEYGGKPHQLQGKNRGNQLIQIGGTLNSLEFGTLTPLLQKFGIVTTAELDAASLSSSSVWQSHRSSFLIWVSAIFPFQTFQDLSTTLCISLFGLFLRH